MERNGVQKGVKQELTDADKARLAENKARRNAERTELVKAGVLPGNKLMAVLDLARILANKAITAIETNPTITRARLSLLGSKATETDGRDRLVAHLNQPGSGVSADTNNGGAVCKVPEIEVYLGSDDDDGDDEIDYGMLG